MKIEKQSEDDVKTVSVSISSLLGWVLSPSLWCLMWHITGEKDAVCSSSDFDIRFVGMQCSNKWPFRLSFCSSASRCQTVLESFSSLLNGGMLLLGNFRVIVTHVLDVNTSLLGLVNLKSKVLVWPCLCYCLPCCLDMFLSGLWPPLFLSASMVFTKF